MSGDNLPDSEAWHQDLFPPLETFEDDKKVRAHRRSAVRRAVQSDIACAPCPESANLISPLGHLFRALAQMLSELHSTVGRYTSHKYNPITFEYACCLASSQDDDDMKRAASFFQGLE
jgi:hypothetical protein